MVRRLLVLLALALALTACAHQPGGGERVCIAHVSARCSAWEYKPSALETMSENRERDAAYREGRPFFPRAQRDESFSLQLTHMTEERDRQTAASRGETYDIRPRRGESPESPSSHYKRWHDSSAR